MISAQNQVKGRITNIQSGEAMSLVTIQAGDHTVVSAVTNHGVKGLALKANDSVTAVVKSTEAMLIKDGGAQIKISARNLFKGQVESIDKGEAMGFVKVSAGSLHLGAAITRQSLDEMQLAAGTPVTVAIKATEVMLIKE
ncbi:MAG: TOBE domain-containing protein [Nitrospirales bacterium]|nr:TOBE domain-containing protein [Nitrospira sp.]MDR4461080.1 TOBE domain-containing protein [Nitrospirales bacterium]